jgi:hypothetical protein
MRFFPRFGSSTGAPQESEGVAAAGAALPANSAGDSAEPPVPESGLLKTVAWVTAALGAVAIGVIVGRELRQRYKFNRRTPYDLYAHSGDELPDADCGVGI